MGSDVVAPSIDVVDLSLPAPQAAAALRKACLEVGFFYLVNHSIAPSLLSAVLSQSKKFFAQSLEQKMEVLQDRNNRGYTPYGHETLDPQHQSRGDTKEGYHISAEISANDPRSSKPLHGPNKWPSPESLPEWRETMMACHEAAVQLTLRLVDLLALALDLPQDYFQHPGFFDDPIVSVRLLHYAAVESKPVEGVFGAGAHSDYGVFTYLMTDVIPGLQICRDRDAEPRIWEGVESKEGALVVNIGDMFERWTNGRFRSTLHRVLMAAEERFSVPLFVEPNFDCLVECLPPCCSHDNPPRYAPITCGEYLLGRFNATYDLYKEEGDKLECGA